MIVHQYVVGSVSSACARFRKFFEQVIAIEKENHSDHSQEKLYNCKQVFHELPDMTDRTQNGVCFSTKSGRTKPHSESETAALNQLSLTTLAPKGVPSGRDPSPPK